MFFFLSLPFAFHTLVCPRTARWKAIIKGYFRFKKNLYITQFYSFFSDTSILDCLYSAGLDTLTFSPGHTWTPPLMRGQWGLSAVESKAHDLGHESLAFITLQVQPMQQVSNRNLLVNTLLPQSAAPPTLSLFPKFRTLDGNSDCRMPLPVWCQDFSPRIARMGKVTEDSADRILRNATVRGTWLSRLSIQLRLRSWSRCSWVQALCHALCWQLGAWSLLQILSPSLSAPPHLCSASLSLKNKYM